MVGTEAQRRSSAQLLGWVLATQGVTALMGAILSLSLSNPGSVGSAFVGLAFLTLFVAATSAAYLEWQRHVLAERFAMLAGALGAPLTMLAMLSGWWLYTPFIGVSTLGVFLAVAYRFSVRNEARHADFTFAS